MGTPPMESGSSNSTTAVLEKGFTCWISGDDGTSATEHGHKKNYIYIFSQKLILKANNNAKNPIKYKKSNDSQTAWNSQYTQYTMFIAL